MVEIQEPSNESSVDLLGVKEQNFVCCIYDELPWIGLVEDVSEEFGDYRIKFMHNHGRARTSHWPSKDDQCWIPETDVHCVINGPYLTSSSTRNYSFSRDDLARISNRCSKWPVDKE
jgi:hypothetical protein